MQNRLTAWMVGVGIVVAVLSMPGLSHAAAGGMPWSGPLNLVLQSLSGEVVQTLAVLTIIGFGIGLAMSDGTGMRWAMGILFGVSIAFAAATWAPGFFGFAGGAVIAVVL